MNYDNANIVVIRGQSKKVFLDRSYVEKWGFLYNVQHGSNIIFKYFFGIVKFWPLSLYFMGNFGANNFNTAPRKPGRPKKQHLSQPSNLRPNRQDSILSQRPLTQPLRQSQRLRDRQSSQSSSWPYLAGFILEAAGGHPGQSSVQFPTLSSRLSVLFPLSPFHPLIPLIPPSPDKDWRYRVVNKKVNNWHFQHHRVYLEWKFFCKKK